MEQNIGMLPEMKLMAPYIPFTHITMGLTVPFLVNDMTKQRIGSVLLHNHGSSLHGPGENIVHCCILSHMDWVHSNAGTNLISAANIMDSFSLEWNIITKGTSWKVAPSGAQWRSYLSQYRVKMLKSSIKHLHI